MKKEQTVTVTRQTTTRHEIKVESLRHYLTSPAHFDVPTSATLCFRPDCTVEFYDNVNIDDIGGTLSWETTATEVM